MTWEEALEYARRRASETGEKWYVRGYVRTVSHIGEWLYAANAEPFPNITTRCWPEYTRPRPHERTH